jgi:hypothetical protein
MSTKPDRESSILRLAFTPGRVKVRGKLFPLDMIRVVAHHVDGKIHWGAMSPEAVAAAVKDLITGSFQIGQAYTLPAVDAALTAFAESDIDQEMYERIGHYFIAGFQERNRKPGEKS